MHKAILLTALALGLAACNQTAGAPPVEARAEPAPEVIPAAIPARGRVAARRETLEEARARACAEAAQNAANVAVGTAVLGGALDVVGAGTWGRGGWAVSAAGHAVANTGAVAAHHQMEAAYARGDCRG